ncbi:MAG: hypothetical protein Fur009_4410 [Candidatus Microgenomates bacterium]
MIKTFFATLKNKVFLNKNTVFLNFLLLDNFKLDYQPGQYLIAKIPYNNEKINRLYSISSFNTLNNNFDLLIELVDNGLGSNYFKNLKIGEQTEFAGPAGVFTLKNTSTPKVFLTTGSGLAPIKAMIDKLVIDKFKNSFYLFWGIKYKNSVYFLDKFKKIQKQNQNFHFKICLSQEKNISDINFFYPGRINTGFIDYFKNNKKIYDFEYYICGSRQITESLKNFLINLNINKDQIFFEKF